MQSDILRTITGHALFPLMLTLLAYVAAIALKARFKWHILQPILTGGLLVALMLAVTGMDMDTYVQGNAILTLLLGPAIVALAIPLYQNLPMIRAYALPILITTVVGGIFTTGLVILIGWLLGVDFVMLLSLSTKSVTASVAYIIAAEVQAIVPLAVVFVIIAGMTGAAFGAYVMRYGKITEPAAVGMAMGLTTHALGTVWALEQSEEAGGFAALAMTLMAILSAILLPVAIRLLV